MHGRVAEKALGIATCALFLLAACGTSTEPSETAPSQTAPGPTVPSTTVPSTTVPSSAPVGGSAGVPPGSVPTMASSAPSAGGGAPSGVAGAGGGPGGTSGAGGARGGGGPGGAAGLGGAGGAGLAGAGGEPAGATLVVSSPAFENVEGCSETNPAVCDSIPDENISYMEQANVSPELHWEGVPEGTRSFAITLSDLSFGQSLWALWNIAGDQTMVPADIAKDTNMPALPAGASQSNATFAEGDGYFGPQAPCNVYQFEVYALSLETFSPSDPEFVTLVKDELQGLGDAILARGTLNARSNFMMMCE